MHIYTRYTSEVGLLLGDRLEIELQWSKPSEILHLVENSMDMTAGRHWLKHRGTWFPCFYTEVGAKYRYLKL